MPHAYPWQVSIKIKSKHKLEHWCGGTLISDRYVLTAAHCTMKNKDLRFKGKPFKNYELLIVLGEHNMEKKDKKEIHIRVKRIIRHPLNRFLSKFSKHFYLNMDKVKVYCTVSRNKFDCSLK